MKLPPDWTKSLLHHLAYVQTGLSKSENRNGPSVKRPYLRVANVQDGYIDLSEMKEISVPIGQVERFTLQKDDLVLTEGGDFDKLGRGCIWNGEIPDCVHQNHIFAVRILDKKVLVPRFLAYQMQSPYGRQYFLSCAKQTTNLASINSSQLKEFPVLFPSYEEQTQIVDLLATWDYVIERAEKLIVPEEKRFSWLLNKLITQRSVKNNWRRVKLGEIFDKELVIEKGKPLIKENTSEGNIPVVAGGQTYAYYHCNATHDMPTITISASGVYAGFVWYHDYPIWASDCNVIYAKNACIEFFFYLLKNQQQKIHALQSGGAQPHVYSKDIKNLVVPVPPIDIQKQIASILNIARQEIDLQKKQVVAYRKQKRGLMQKLLTGQWRVKSGEEVIG